MFEVMTTAEQILVVFLSVALAVLLVIAIIIGVYIVRIVKRIDKVAAKAEHVADSAEAVGSAIRKTVSDLRMVNVLRNIADIVRGKDKTTKQTDDKDKGE